MGKKGTKKINHRVKRSARKTIGVLTLIMAIIVAAIPTPSARAVGGTEDDKKEENRVSPPVYPAYGANDELTTDQKEDIKLPTLADYGMTEADLERAQLIYRSSSGEYFLNDVFTYWMFKDDFNNMVGCIYKYNPSFVPEANKLEVPDLVRHEYRAYTREQVLDYFNSGDQVGEDEIPLYFPEVWAEYQKQLDAYNAYVSWNNDPNKDRLPTPNPLVTEEPAKPQRTVKDFLLSNGAWVNDNGLRYFCSHYSDLVTYIRDTKNDAGDLEFSGYMLLMVTDERAGDNFMKPAYMPCKVGSPSEYSASKDYSSEFFVPVEGTNHIRYIGDEAFAEAERIEHLIIPKEIISIGNGAFRDCSALKTISAYAGTIGNRAFKGCSNLETVSLEVGVVTIGAECFYGCNSLTAISFPSGLKKIGFGAFAECQRLNTITMDKVSANLVLGDYCFFNCPSIGSVTFGVTTKEIGEAAFALTEDTSMGVYSWTDVTLPSGISTLGDYVLYGRNNIKTVVMPSSFGTGAAGAELGAGFFGKCTNLQYVEFPDPQRVGSCGFVTFPTNAFIDVLSEDFYIRGPEINSRGGIASPRECAWTAGITYVFKDSNGVDQYEVSTGTYRFAVDTDGVLTKCTLLDKEKWKEGWEYEDDDGNTIVVPGGEINVPATVGSKTVTGIGPDCFNDKYIRDNLQVLKIADGGAVASIADHAFEGYSKLKIVYVGDSVNEIGTSAFENCSQLQTVVFSTPKGGYQNFKIGPNAFSTNSDKLTFYGDIVKGYAPFDWAMSQENWMNADELLRVCYCSGTPDHPNLKVLLDNDTNEVTLVGYPHYEQLDEVTRHLYEVGEFGIPLDKDLTNGQTSLNAEQTRWLDEALHIVIPEGIESIDVVGFCKSSSNGMDRDTYMSGDEYYAMYRAQGLFNGYYGEDGEWEFPENQRDRYEQESRGNDRIQTIEMHSVKRLPDRAFESCENLYMVALGSALEDIGTAPFTGCGKLTSVGGNNKYPCDNGIIYETNETGGLTIVECLPARGALVGSPGVNATNDSKLLQVTRINEGAFENCASITDVDLTVATKLTQIPAACFKNTESLMTVLLPEAVDDIRSEAFYKKAGGFLSVEIPATEVDIADDAFNHKDAPQMVYLYSYKGSAVENYADRMGHTFKEVDKTYRVQFWDYDGTPLSIENEDGTKTTVQYVEHGRAATAPEDPTGRKDGYVFDKWDKPFTNVTSDLIIIALYKWGYPDTSPGVLPNTSPGANNPNNNGTPTPTPNGTPAPGSGTPGAGTPGAGTPGAGTPGASNNDQNSNQRYRLTVQNGSGSGTYLAGTTVVITADAPPSGQRFDRWTSISNDFNITSATSSITTITMPSHDMTIVANYTSGSGSSNGNNGNSTNISSNTNGNGNSGGTTVDITKPGISDTDVASATVEGSTDNYVVKITDTAEARAAVEAALINEYGTLDNLRYFAMDISLYDSTGTVKITDTSNLAVNITMPIPDELRLYAGNNQVAGVVNGNVLDKLSPRFTTINGIPCISFTATHFSPYTVYVDTSNLSAGVSDSTPKTGDMIHPKWFLAVALACISFILLLKKDKKQANVKAA